MTWFDLLIAVFCLERLAELAIARRNQRWSQRHGAVEFGARHYPVMVALHTGLLAGALIEVSIGHRRFIPALGWPMLALLILSQVLRWWCITSLGRQWNTRVLVVPGAPRIAHGPYRYLTHPNYVAVVVEGLALPLVHSAWITAACFTVANAGLLTVRVRTENIALRALAAEVS